MSLESVQSMTQKALAEGYAIGYFESWNLESLQGAVDAAEQTCSPIIVGFNGEYLSNAHKQQKERVGWYAALGQAAAKSASVPCGLIFNECLGDDMNRLAIDVGFNCVMPANPNTNHEDYLRVVADFTAYAHKRGVAVEAELGELPSGSAGEINETGSVTDPDVAAEFVKATNVDLLAVSVGNVHIMVKGKQGLDLEHLAEIQRKVSVPLVLHGGTGISADSLKEAIKLGVAKVNYGTYLKQRYLKTVRDGLENECQDPHRLLGNGGDEDIMVLGRRAVREAVLERIGLLGCCGKAKK